MDKKYLYEKNSQLFFVCFDTHDILMYDIFHFYVSFNDTNKQIKIVLVSWRDHHFRSSTNKQIRDYSDWIRCVLNVLKSHDFEIFHNSFFHF